MKMDAILFVKDQFCATRVTKVIAGRDTLQRLSDGIRTAF